MMELLEIKELRGGYLPDLNILNGVDLSVGAGETVGVIGLNGCGKSTLTKAIMNMIPYRSGTVYFSGMNISPLPLMKISRLGISLMQQGGVVFSNLSVADNIEIALSGHDKAMYPLLKEMIPLLSLPDKELTKLMADKLSGGQRHQLALAMALASRPKLVILDEPSAGLSPKAVTEIYQLLERIRREMNVSALIVEQNIDKAIEFCDKCVFLSQGTVVEVYENNDREATRSAVMRRLGL